MSKRELLLKLDRDTYCCIGRSRIHGVGVIAIREIPRGANPFKCPNKEKDYGFKESELKTLNPKVRRMIHNFFCMRNGRIWIPSFGLNGINISYFLNHSIRPNVRAVDGGNTFVTLRRIKSGEELTSDYATYDDSFSIQPRKRAGLK